MATRKNTKAISDEEIIAAILQAGTIKAVAASLDISSFLFSLTYKHPLM